MVGLRPACKARKPNGDACRATLLRESEFCFWHDPEHADDADKARRLGGERRRREHIVAGAYEVESLDTVADLRRLLVIATTDALSSTENSLTRARTLVAIAGMGSKLLESGELEARIEALEQVIASRSKDTSKGRRR